MGRHFRKDTSYEKYLSDNPECMTKLCKTLIEKKSLLVYEESGKINGMLGFMIYEHFISGDLTAGEIFWWVEPQHRGSGIKLLKEMEKRAREAGVKNMQMIAPNDDVANFYERIGYGFVESTYQMAL